MSKQELSSFQNHVLAQGELHYRQMPWRNSDNPYHVLVSEVMLQQTQVGRVLQKFPEFISAFPDLQTLAGADLKDILSCWQGMGYNRRAIYLKNSADILLKEYDAVIPNNPAELERLPGIGKATAASISAFAFGKPAVFIETNIRRVFLHHFFQERRGVKDSEIFPLIDETLFVEDPRRWYYALMDYGSVLIKSAGNANIGSAHYTIQARFEGSRRQLRGEILAAIIQNGTITFQRLQRTLQRPPKQVREILSELEKEGFLSYEENYISIK